MINEYKNFCQNKKLIFDIHEDILSPDSTTLFMSSGMQRYKHLFKDTRYKGTFTNIQKCLRLNDLNEIGDGTHSLSFDMIGLFSFRELTVKQSIDFMMQFCISIGITPDYVTIHPDKVNEWSHFYDDYSFVEIRIDNECTWSDGNLGGYCTEFYKNNIEIGNIVNTIDTCIDVGFGVERLLLVLGYNNCKTKLQLLEETCLLLINNNVTISHWKQGHVLKKLVSESLFLGSKLDNDIFNQVRNSHLVIYKNFLNLSKRNSNKNKPMLYYKETMGFDIEHLDYYKQLEGKHEKS